MKRVWSLLSMSTFVLFLVSCNNEPAKEETKPADSAATTSTTPQEVKPEFKPFKVVAIQHKVKNFDKAMAGYFSRDSLLRSYGINHYVLARDLKDSNQIFVLDKIEDVEKTKTFFDNPKVKETMAKAGVSRPPGYSYVEFVRANDAPWTNAEAMSIAHHVKDYDAWLKAFDANVSDRAANGMIDRAIARDINDPNTVYVTFEVSDLAKAKARMASPELKKIMADAGVDSPPTIRWFKVIK